MGEGTGIRTITFEPGYMVLTDEEGDRVRQPIADILRALDIPVGLTHTQVASISALANLVVILIRTLIERGVLGESFLEDDDMDLEHIIAAIEAMGGSYEDPGLEAADE